MSWKTRARLSSKNHHPSGVVLEPRVEVTCPARTMVANKPKNQELLVGNLSGIHSKDGHHDMRVSPNVTAGSQPLTSPMMACKVSMARHMASVVPVSPARMPNR